MGWSHSEISLEDVVNLIKGFVDILILASGYQSSGLPAIWDSSNVKKALQWGLFFEHVLRHLSISDDYQGSVDELDAALFEMKSTPYFPQGLSDLSSATLSRARDLVVRHIIHTFPLRDSHLNALLTASVEMDLDEIRRTDNDSLIVYLEKLRLQSVSTAPLPSSAIPDIKTREHASACHSELIIQELSKRQDYVSRVLSVELGLDIFSESVTQMYKGISRNGISSLSAEKFAECDAWIHWRSKNLSYLLDKRTVRLVSGANLIFSAPKAQWIQVFDRLECSKESQDDSLEMIEMLLLGCVSSRWTQLIKHFLSLSQCYPRIPNQYQEVQNVPHGRSRLLHSEQENSIVEYMMASLSNQFDLLWKLSPILAAIAIPSWSPLFRWYMSGIEKQYKDDSPTIRCCTCTRDAKKHIDCELAERIWCLHVIHVQGSPQMDSK